MKQIARIITVILVAMAGCSAWAQDICSQPVSTGEGPVRGMPEPGLDVCVYKGIPYAIPPVDELRWRAPQQPHVRSGILDAIEFSPMCVQKGEGKEISEDCLYLNVWRPMKSGTFPVMVWIHGGALLTGTGSYPVYWGDRISSQYEMVVVNFNYRLGPFGFISHRELAEEDPHNSAGNYGLLDQVKALQWIKDNIAGFGGDPENITIFGESAGGWSVCYHLACPLSKGLFHRAILQSGGCDNIKTEEEGFADGETFADKLGCHGPEALKCMRQQPQLKILEAMWGHGGNLLSPDAMKFLFIPKEDGYALKETPIEAIRSGRFNNVPLMVGSTRDETKMYSFQVPGCRLVAPPILEPAVHLVFGIEKEVIRGIRRHYLYKDYRRPADAFIDALGDMTLGCKCYDAAETVSLHQPQTFYYRFDYDGNRYPHQMGAGHFMEVGFVFNTLDRSFYQTLYTERQLDNARPLVEMMMDYWTNFARMGDPNGPGLQHWPAYDTQEKKRMYLDLPAQVQRTDNKEKCEFWKAQDVKLK